MKRIIFFIGIGIMMSVGAYAQETRYTDYLTCSAFCETGKSRYKTIDECKVNLCFNYCVLPKKGGSENENAFNTCVGNLRKQYKITQLTEEILNQTAAQCLDQTCIATDACFKDVQYDENNNPECPTGYALRLIPSGIVGGKPWYQCITENKALQKHCPLPPGMYSPATASKKQNFISMLQQAGVSKKPKSPVRYPCIKNP